MQRNPGGIELVVPRENWANFVRRSKAKERWMGGGEMGQRGQTVAKFAIRYLAQLCQNVIVIGGRGGS